MIALRCVCNCATSDASLTSQTDFSRFKMNFHIGIGSIRFDFRIFAGLSALALLSGCGGGTQDFGGLSRSLGGDIGTGYNNSLGGTRSATGQAPNTLVRGTYPMIETSFQLPTIPGDPFDYEKVNVQITLKQPDGATIDVPCFFDGRNHLEDALHAERSRAVLGRLREAQPGDRARGEA